LFTSIFAHFGFLHFLFNMMFLYCQLNLKAHQFHCWKP
jgi:membrane associated rhomboid family serine protease